MSSVLWAATGGFRSKSRESERVVILGMYSTSGGRAACFCLWFLLVALSQTNASWGESKGSFLYFSEESGDSTQNALGFCGIILERNYRGLGWEAAKRIQFAKKNRPQRPSTGPQLQKIRGPLCSPGGQGSELRDSLFGSNSSSRQQGLDLFIGDNQIGSGGQMAADPAWITNCNRLMRKIGQEMRGEMRRNYYASTTPFHFSGDCAEASKPRYLLVARAGIYFT